MVGGGILGTAHAWQAVSRGHEVTQLEREHEARGATVRNFGLVWVSGRAVAELATTLRSRELWERLGEKVPGIGFRPSGSLTLIQPPLELAVAEDVAARPDAADRGFKLLEPAEAREVNPALRGEFLAALWCERDAAVESRVAMPALRDHLQLTGRYRFEAGVQVAAVDQKAPPSPSPTTRATGISPIWRSSAQVRSCRGWPTPCSAPNRRYAGSGCR